MTSYEAFNDDENSFGMSADEEDIMNSMLIKTELAPPTRLSKSILYDLISNFYSRNGIKCWSERGVPHFITSNAFVAKCYVHIFAGFIADCFLEGCENESGLRLDANEKLYIIEIGAGFGKFAFYFLKILHEISSTLRFPMNRICYVMTDIVQSNIDFYKTQQNLKPFIDEGIIDFGRFDATADVSLTLQVSGVEISSKNPAVNPIVFITNYVFDSLPNDIFQVRDSQLYEGLITLGSCRENETDPNDPKFMEFMQNKFTYKRIKNELEYYLNCEGKKTELEFQLSLILNFYKQYFSECSGLGDAAASFILPVGGMKMLYNLSKLCENRMIMITSDKGTFNPDNFYGLKDPFIAVDGTLSLMVNYHALRLYFLKQGGLVLHNKVDDANLNTSCFISSGPKKDEATIPHAEDVLDSVSDKRLKRFPNCVLAFDDLISFGPGDFYRLQQRIGSFAYPSIRDVNMVLNVSNWDPDIYFKFRETILHCFFAANLDVRKDLLKNIDKVWSNFFYFHLSNDIAFELGRFYFGCGSFKKSISYFEKSIDLFGCHHITLHNMGLAYHCLGNRDKAEHYFRKSRM